LFATLRNEPDLMPRNGLLRLNAATRLHMPRLTRFALAFSKKLVNLDATVGLDSAYYDLVRQHGSLRCTLALAAGIERDY